MFAEARIDMSWFDQVLGGTGGTDGAMNSTMAGAIGSILRRPGCMCPYGPFVMCAKLAARCHECGFLGCTGSWKCYVCHMQRPCGPSAEELLLQAECAWQRRNPADPDEPKAKPVCDWQTWPAQITNGTNDIPSALSKSKKRRESTKVKNVPFQ